MSHRHRRHAGALVLVLVLVPGAVVVSPGAGPGWAQERSTTELERELGSLGGERGALEDELGEVRTEIAATEAALAELGARLDDARGRLRAAEGQVALGEVALAEAEEEQRRAEAAHRSAEELLVVAERELEAEESQLSDHLVQAFKYGTVGAQRGAMILEVLRRAGDPNDFAVGLKQLQTVVDVQDATVERVFALRVAREQRADEAARSRSRATQATAAATSTLATLQELRSDAAAIAEQIAEDEAAHEQLLAGLRTDEAATRALLRRVATRQAQLEADLAAERARQEAARRAAAGSESGSASGGRLSLPGAGGGPDLSGVVCPVRGAVAGRDFSNDWGYPRSGGRYHQGNDIFAAHGTPVIAVADGTVVSWNPPSAPTRLGGITVTYRTADGSEWYHAHLASLAEGVAPGARVAGGQVIGTVGNTGNAISTPPHLHLGRRYGGVPVNPWPTISPVC